MDYDLFINKIETQYNKGLPFVMYALPERHTIVAFLQKDKTLYQTEDFLEESFVFAPFDYKKTTFCIPEDKSDSFKTIYIKEAIPINDTVAFNDDKDKVSYMSLVETTVNVIQNQNADKIVTSRNKCFSLNDFQIKDAAKRLLNLYPTAFRYIWFHPETGLWCGASPETLLKTKASSFTTMALAGTKKVIENEPPNWTNKERKEQQFVIDSISESLQKVTAVLKISKTYNHRAASLVHLRTDITGVFKKRKVPLPAIVSVLHPTPAVCGRPQKFSKEFIQNNEGYNREFYTGFMGPISEKNESSNLFVNLRCMKIENNVAQVYVGGGITKESNPENEWNETQHKLQTMLQVIEPMI